MYVQAKPVFTPEQLAKVLHYDPINGSFTWRLNNKRRGIVAGDAVTGTHDGVLCIRLGAAQHHCNKLAWYLNYGVWPSRLSVVDGDRSNLRLRNLHPVLGIKYVRRWVATTRDQLQALPESIYMDYLTDYQRIGYKLRQGGLTYEQSERHIMIMGLPALLRPLPLPPDL